MNRGKLASISAGTTSNSSMGNGNNNINNNNNPHLNHNGHRNTIPGSLTSVPLTDINPANAYNGLIDNQYLGCGDAAAAATNLASQHALQFQHPLSGSSLLDSAQFSSKSLPGVPDDDSVLHAGNPLDGFNTANNQYGGSSSSLAHTHQPHQHQQQHIPVSEHHPLHYEQAANSFTDAYGVFSQSYGYEAEFDPDIEDHAPFGLLPFNPS